MKYKRAARPTKGFRRICRLKLNRLLVDAETTAAGCIEPKCARHRKGYGWVGILGKAWLAHRIAWVALKGNIPTNKILCHSCNNRACINILHLRIGTFRDNNIDCVKSGTWKFGKRGLVLDPEKVIEIRSRYASGEITQRRLAKEFNVNQATISHVTLKKQWRHV